VCDRDELRNQALGALQTCSGRRGTISGGNAQKNARILIATYQTLGVDSDDTDEADASFLTANYPPDYFSHIIIDECHRSAWGKWSQVLTHNPNAVQVGLTATPRQLIVSEKTKEAIATSKSPQITLSISVSLCTNMTWGRPLKTVISLRARLCAATYFLT